MITKDQLKDFISQIKAATGKTQRQISVSAGYKENSLSELVAQKNGNYDPVYRQLELVYGDALKNSIPSISNDGNNEERFTADQLFHMYMKAMERQDKIMEVQTAILKNIESKMAKEKTLAKTASNSIEILAGVRSLSRRQKSLMDELKPRKVHRLPDSDKSPRQNGEAEEKRGKMK